MHTGINASINASLIALVADTGVDSHTLPKQRLEAAWRYVRLRGRYSLRTLRATLPRNTRALAIALPYGKRVRKAYPVP